jgi:DNA-binding CsgD family transcriptional regulator
MRRRSSPRPSEIAPDAADSAIYTLWPMGAKPARPYPPRMQALHDPFVITARQRQVVELIAQGLSNEEIGVVLGISPRTAKAHSDALRQKLGVPRRRQIPVAFRLLTGEDPLATRLASARADNGG